MIRTRICSIAFFAISFIMSGTRSYAQSWVQVGSAGFSAGTMQFPTIVINASGTPYLVYEDVANGYKA